MPMKSATRPAPTLPPCAGRRPAIPWSRAPDQYQAINIVIIFLALLAVVVGWSLIAPEQLRFAT